MLRGQRSTRPANGGFRRNSAALPPHGTLRVPMPLALQNALPTSGLDRPTRYGFPERVFSALLIVLALAWLAVPVQAQTACPCGFCPANRSPFFAVNVAPELAPNARIFARLDGFDLREVRLRTSSGAPIPFALEPAGDDAGTAFWVVPDAPLSPGSYVLAASLAVGQEFVVLPGDDTTPPPVGGLRIGTVARSDYCSDLTGGWISWETGPDSDVSRSVFAVEVELWRDGAMFARVFPAQPVFITPVEFGTSPNPECFGSAHVDGLIEGEQLTARVRVWDMAGNATGFESSTFTVARSGPVQCLQSCAATPGRHLPPTGHGLLALLALLLAASSRRREDAGPAAGPAVRTARVD